MNDDLVKRLRRDLASGLSASIGDTEEAANRIEALKKEIEWMAEKYQSVTRRAHAHAAEAAKRIETLEERLRLSEDRLKRYEQGVLTIRRWIETGELPR